MLCVEDGDGDVAPFPRSARFHGGHGVRAAKVSDGCSHGPLGIMVEKKVRGRGRGVVAAGGREEGG